MKELIAIQSELKAPKGQLNKFGGYNYRSCEDILEAVKPLLTKHQTTLTLSDEVVQIGNFIFVKATAQLVSASGSTTVSAFARHPADKKGMDDSQITGATSSYARKYALNGLFCIDDTKDADATNDHGKGDTDKRGDAKAGQPQSGTHTRQSSPKPPQGGDAAQQTTPKSETEILLSFMATMRVTREDLEDAIGAKVEDFTPEEKQKIKDAVVIMRRDKCDFLAAFTAK